MAEGWRHRRNLRLFRAALREKYGVTLTACGGVCAVCGSTQQLRRRDMDPQLQLPGGGWDETVKDCWPDDLVVEAICARCYSGGSP